jgi:hypothetical protein
VSRGVIRSYSGYGAGEEILSEGKVNLTRDGFQQYWPWRDITRSGLRTLIRLTFFTCIVRFRSIERMVARRRVIHADSGSYRQQHHGT